MKEYVAPQITCIELRTEEKIGSVASGCILMPSSEGACPTGREMCWIGQGS